MIPLNEGKNIIEQLQLKNKLMTGMDFTRDVSQIAYHIDVFQCGKSSIINKHIDVEFSFGEYLEIQEDEELYRYLFDLCNLQLVKADTDTLIILYQKDSYDNEDI